MTRKPKHFANEQGVMSLGDHLEDLRKRVVWAVAGLLPLVIALAFVGDRILLFMIAPVLAALKSEGQDPRVRAFNPLESFTAYFYVVVMASLVVGSPWVMYQLWRFVSPGLYAHERRFAYLLAPMSIVLTIAGFCVMRFGMLPLAMVFFVHFGITLLPAPEPHPVETPAGVVLPVLPVLDGDPAKPQVGQEWYNLREQQRRLCVSIDSAGKPDIRSVAYTRATSIQQDYNLREYVNLFVQLSLIFVLAFQLPLVMLLLSWAGIITPQLMGKYRRHAIAGVVIGSALISPTGDPLSLAMLQVPLYGLYELGILMMRVLPASRVAGPIPDPDADEDDQQGKDAGGDAGGAAARTDSGGPPGGPATGP